MRVEFRSDMKRDNNFNFSGIQVLIDPKSAIYLKGIELDFKDGLSGKVFNFDDSNAKKLLVVVENKFLFKLKY